ncbi:bet3 family protein [Moniliophthora roreri MCA 2997]|uniref:Bet3 family protein n=1 Tax=Moniliophthora roreri (strain MCA 2997) TaxID=1381753 RepID=V2WY43_MONRO|nr:bet3 family protein [Moniliophthora roreri MCA 2997]
MTSRNSSQASSKPMSSLAALAEPPMRFVDGAMMDYLLIEVVNTLRESSAVATARSKKIEQEMLEAGLIPPAPAVTQPSTPRDSVTSLNSRNTGKAVAMVDEEEEAIRIRLEAIGMHVGANFAERLCRDRPLFTETLDVIKFICKDVWAAFWDKQVDNLRTNHRGVYVLQDNSFKTISRLSSWRGRPEAMKRAKLYVAMPAGIIKGVLSRLGYQGVTVTPEINSLPQCTFQVKIPRNS